MTVFLLNDAKPQIHFRVQCIWYIACTSEHVGTNQSQYYALPALSSSVNVGPQCQLFFFINLLLLVYTNY